MRLFSLMPGNMVAESAGLAACKSNSTTLPGLLIINQRPSGLDPASPAKRIIELVGFSPDKSQSREPVELLGNSQGPSKLNAAPNASGSKSKAITSSEANFQSRAGLALVDSATSHLPSGLSTSFATFCNTVARGLGAVKLYSVPELPCWITSHRLSALNWT